MEDIRNGLLVLEKLDKNEVGTKALSNEDMYQILIFAFSESVSEYWPNLALKVLESNNNYLIDNVRIALEDAINSKWSTQNFRHRAKRLLRK